MAQPLTSTDILRERMGFGVSPLASEETKRSYAAAGLQPLTTTERQAFERGGGISPMAGATGQDAWKMAQYMAGERENAPVSYGGLGDRPVGTSRRSIRMQAEWDKQQKELQDMQRAAQQMDLNQRQFALSEREQMLRESSEARIQAAQSKVQEEAFKVSQQADLAVNEILGGVDQSGSPVSGLDPDSDDYMQRRNEIIKRYPKAFKDDAFKAALATTDKSYFDRVNFDQQLKSQEESSSRIISRQIEAEERAAERQRGIREEERTQAEERNIVSQEREIDKQIREQRQALAGISAQKQTPKSQQASKQAANKLLDLRIERAALRGLVFETEEDAEKANPPSGSVIYIGRKPFKVP